MGTVACWFVFVMGWNLDGISVLGDNFKGYNRNIWVFGYLGNPSVLVLYPNVSL